MKTKDIIIGMRVVPHDKTVGVVGLCNSSVWNDAKKIKQPFLYVRNVWKKSRKGEYVLSIDQNHDGDFFDASDFEPYKEKPLEETIVITKSDMQKLLADVWHNGCVNGAESMNPKIIEKILAKYKVGL